MLEQLKALGPSIIRTVSPWLVGLVVTGLARFGVDWTPTPEALALAAALVAAAWYAVVRWLETQRSARWGWLLGLPGAPTYGARDGRDGQA